MKEPKRYSCGNGEGMFDNEKGYWVSYKEHLEIVNKLKEAITVIPCCKSDSEQLVLFSRFISNNSKLTTWMTSTELLEEFNKQK